MPLFTFFFLSPKKEKNFLTVFSSSFSEKMTRAPKKKKTQKQLKRAEKEIEWGLVEEVISSEIEALGQNMGTLAPTASIADFSLQTLLEDIKQWSPHLWDLLAKALEKDESRKIKTNDRRDTFLLFIFSALAKMKNMRANRFSMFVGLFLVSKGTPSTVSFLFFSLQFFECLLSGGRTPELGWWQRLQDLDQQVALRKGRSMGPTPSHLVPKQGASDGGLR